MDFYIDILEPSSDLNESMENLGKTIGVLYAEAWEKNKKRFYANKPFDLNINAFAYLWFDKSMKIFVVYTEQTNEPIGFLVSHVFRPMPYKASIFQIQEWYVRDHPEWEQELLTYVTGAVKLLGCDEIWIQTYSGQAIDFGPKWKPEGEYNICRYTKG